VIIVRLMGGLGNQLFQYAAARRLAHDAGQPLKLDISGYDADPLRAFALRPFNVRQDIASRAEIDRLKASGGLLRRLRPSRTWVRERTPYTFDPRVVEPREDVYLDGYWANEEYFRSIEPVIREEFTVRTQPDAANEAAAGAIRSVASVCVHVRRGDYVTDSHTSAFHGLAPLEYYRTAAARVAAAVGRPHFFVFSDDPEWVRQNLRFEHPTTYVRHNGDRDYEDLRLMALCRHHIIANSSFSWWGAWLGQSPGQQVFAPARWLTQPEIDTTEATPARWIRL
jgi:glycosyl transferase family 11